MMAQHHYESIPPPRHRQTDTMWHGSHLTYETAAAAAMAGATVQGVK